MIRVAGVLILSPWDLRRAARRVFPGSRINQRRWMRAWVSRPSEIRVPIARGHAERRECLRESRIPEGTRFIEAPK